MTMARRPLLQSLIVAVLRRRHRFPRALNRAIDHVADHPEGFWGRLAVMAVGRVDPAKIPPPTRVPDAPIRVYISPTNYSGQAHLWAQSLMSTDPNIGAVNVAVDVPEGFSFIADTVVPPAVFARSETWQRAEYDVVTQFTHVMFEAERPIFGRLFGRDIRRELGELRSKGISVAMMAHGTDARLPSRHATATDWSPYLDPDLYLDKLESEAKRNIALLADVDTPVFVSTPDLLDDVPWATWCPVTVNVDRWARPRRTRTGPLRVVHAPSKTAIKGTHLIEPVLAGLHEEGLIEYRRLEGVSHVDMPDRFAEADVVLDQFRLGSYGVAACESMAAGCVTVGHVLPHVRSRVEQSSGGAAPIVEATPESLGDVIRRLIDDPERRVRLSEEGREFVRRTHDGRASAEILREHWIAPSVG